jgi:hypothetical protein
MGILDDVWDLLSEETKNDLEKVSRGNFDISEESRREIAESIVDKMEGSVGYTHEFSDSVSIRASKEENGEVRIRFSYDF